METLWILVADSARARLLAGEQGAELEERRAFTHPESRGAGREITTDRPPRTHDRLGNARHAIEPRSTIRDVAAETFARELVSVLEHGRTGNEFDALVLVAPPRFLGKLHAAMDKPLRSLVVSEVRKDLVTASRDVIHENVEAARSVLMNRTMGSAPP